MEKRAFSTPSFIVQSVKFGKFAPEAIDRASEGKRGRGEEGKREREGKVAEKSEIAKTSVKLARNFNYARQIAKQRVALSE